MATTAFGGAGGSLIIGHRDVDDGQFCVLTRMRFRHIWQALYAYVNYRRLSAVLTSAIETLARSAVWWESPTVIVTFSIWHSVEGIHELGASHRHVELVRWAIRNAKEIWSTSWIIAGVSPRDKWG